MSQISVTKDDVAEHKAEAEQLLKETVPLIEEHDNFAPVDLRDRIWTKIRAAAEEYRMAGYSENKLAKEISNKINGWRSANRIRDVLRLPEQAVPKQPPNEFELANTSGIKIYEDAVAVFENVLEKMRNGPWDELMEDQPRAERDRLLPALLKLAQQFLDDRSLVAQQAMPLFFDQLATLLPSDAYTHYLNKAKDAAARLDAKLKLRGIYTIDDITGKQLSRIVGLRVPKVPPQYIPFDKETAQILNFTGETCPKCKGVRVDVGPEGGKQRRCIDCNRVYEGIYPSIPQKERVVIDASGSTHKL
jgi:hypothetical protein